MEKLNIRSDGENPVAKILSNLAPTPFEYEGIKFASVESALQGIKFKDENIQKEVFAMTGLQALKTGRKITNSIDETKNTKHYYVYWKGKKMPYNGTEHRELVLNFIREKIKQNKEVQKALLDTKDFFIYHDVGEESPNTSLPEKVYIKMLLEERAKLENENK